MPRPLRYLPPECPLVEVTCRTLHGRLLLRPSKKLNKLIIGVLARAARRYDVGVCAFVFLSNHCHLLLRPKNAQNLATFMNYLNSNVAREAGRLHGWREKFWARRYRPVAVSCEPEAQIARLRYLLAQGCKEGLVARPQDWPGASSVRALLGAGVASGVWYDRTAAYWARRRSQAVAPEQFACAESLRLQPLPCWDQLPAEMVQAHIRELVTTIEADTRRQLREDRRRPLGPSRVMRQNPCSRPQQTPRSPAPRFHAASAEIRKMLEVMYRAYRDAYADAVKQLQRCSLPTRVCFPRYGIPPPRFAVAVSA